MTGAYFGGGFLGRAHSIGSAPAVQVVRAVPRYRSAGTLPGGLTTAEWALLTESQRQSYIEREVQTARDTAAREGRDATAVAAQTRERLVTESVAALGRTAVELIRDENARASRSEETRANTEVALARSRAEAEQARLRAELETRAATERRNAELGFLLAGGDVNSLSRLAAGSTGATTNSGTQVGTSSVPLWAWLLGGIFVLGGGYYFITSKPRRGR